MEKITNYHHGNLRVALMEAALALLDEEGVEAVGIRQIARKVGVAHSAPANHFKNKKALFTALAIEIFRDLTLTIQSKFEGQTENFRDSVHHFAKTIFDFGIKFPNRYKLLWRQDCVDNSSDMLNDVMEEMYQLLTTILQEHAKQQNIDVESQSIAMWSLIHGYVSLRLSDNLGAGHDEVTGIVRESAIIDVLIDGLIANQNKGKLP